MPSATLEAVLGAALDIARRRRHPVVRAPHVLSAVLGSAGMNRAVRRRGFDADHLAAAVDRALDDAPEVAAYRDASPPRVCSSIERAFQRVEKLVIAYGRVELVAALDDAPELRGAFRPYVLDESLLEALRREAPGRDIADAMTWLLANHLDLAERLVDGGLDTEDLTTRCGRMYRDVLPDVVDAARAAGLRSVEPTLLMTFLTREIAYAAGYELPLIGEALERLLHGAPSLDDVADDEPSEVVVVNDPFTQSAAVQTIFTSHFGMSELEAYDAMLAVDARDSLVVARLAGAEGRELATVVRRAARRDGFPLRIVVRAATR